VMTPFPSLYAVGVVNFAVVICAVIHDWTHELINCLLLRACRVAMSYYAASHSDVNAV